MLSIEFSGWFQCRLATDSDPSDEPRGLTGFTRAVPGEADLDRLIRFTRRRKDVYRQPGPSVGVKVTKATIDGTSAVAALEGGSVDLIEDAKFEGRNGLAFDDALEPILPFHIVVSGRDVKIGRAHRNPVTEAWQQDSPIEVDPQALALMNEAIGTRVPDEFFHRRRGELKKAIARERDPLARLALTVRRQHLKEVESIAAIFLGFAMRYRLVLQGRWAHIEDPHQRLGCRPDTGPWICSLWMGVWDTDALCGFAKGTLDIPLR